MQSVYLLPVIVLIYPRERQKSDPGHGLRPLSLIGCSGGRITSGISPRRLEDACSSVPKFKYAEGPKVSAFDAARAIRSLGKQLGANLGELHVSAAFVHDEPPALDRELEAGAVFGRWGLELDTSPQLINFSIVSNTDQRRTFERLHA
jgi:hypothetical protein